MWAGSTRYKKIRTFFSIAVIVFFAAGAVTEYFLSRSSCHASEYIGNMLWRFAEKDNSAVSWTELIPIISKDFCRYAACLIILFLFSFTVYAPAVSFSVAVYGAFTFGNLCIQFASDSIDYLIRAGALAASAAVISELCVYSAYLGRELARRCPPKTKLIAAMPEVRELFVLLCISSCKLLLFTAAYHLVMQRL